MESSTISLQDPAPDGKTSDPIIYSYSTLKNQAVCPARLYFKKQAKEGKIKEDINLPMVFGSAVHKGIEERLKYERNPFEVAQNYVAEKLEEANYPSFGSKEYEDKQKLLTSCLTNFEEYFYEDLRTSLSDPEHQVELKLETPFRKGLLVGVVDIALPGIFADWKSGTRIPSDFSLSMEPQSGFYFYLAQKTGMETPKEFVYVYLTGRNVNYVKSERTGKLTADRNNRMMKFSFPVYPTEESVNSLLNNYIMPLAKQYEEGVIYKNPSDYNCGSCLYKTACWSTDLPLIND